MIVRCAVGIAALLVATTPARAHDVAVGIGGFYGGLMHPLLVPAHLLALAALGLCIGQHAPRQRAILLALFAASLVAGVIVIVSAFAMTAAEYAILAVAAAAGLAVAIARPQWLIVSTPLAVVAGAAIELDSVPQEISMAATFLALSGSAVAAFLIVMVLSDLTAYWRRDWQRIAVRIAGSWIAASAILVLALRLAR
jgi:urease accessory protein